MRPIHQPVLGKEVLEWLAPGPGSILVDGTVGGGGHSASLAGQISPGGTVIGLDRDPAMLALARQNLVGLPVNFVLASYAELRQVLEHLGVGRVNGVLLDLGLSSDQLAWSDRGFSFAFDGPLDMRFDPNASMPTAEKLVNECSPDELAQIFLEFGEERFSKRIAHAIVGARQHERISTTRQLADLIQRCVPGPNRSESIHPATRVFQALRIVVNNELAQLDIALNDIPDCLADGGRLAIISFHSLEDRRVKRAFKTDSRLKVLTKKPLTASARELAVNPRSRSAKLRVAERCPS
jgi:16S rRNA (cytosine1402-N4)-methyltransferase